MNAIEILPSKSSEYASSSLSSVLETSILVVGVGFASSFKGGGCSWFEDFDLILTS
jgi:hypothetical protein